MNKRLAHGPRLDITGLNWYELGGHVVAWYLIVKAFVSFTIMTTIVLIFDQLQKPLLWYIQQCQAPSVACEIILSPSGCSIDSARHSHLAPDGAKILLANLRALVGWLYNVYNGHSPLGIETLPILVQVCVQCFVLRWSIFLVLFRTSQQSTQDMSTFLAAKKQL